jgi:hypothetical protein
LEKKMRQTLQPILHFWLWLCLPMFQRSKFQRSRYVIFGLSESSAWFVSL